MHADRSLLFFSHTANLAELAGSRGDRETAERLAEEGLLLAKSLGITEEYPEEAVRDTLSILRRILGL